MSASEETFLTPRLRVVSHTESPMVLAAALQVASLRGEPNDCVMVAKAFQGVDYRLLDKDPHAHIFPLDLAHADRATVATTKPLSISITARYVGDVAKRLMPQWLFIADMPVSTDGLCFWDFIVPPSVNIVVFTPDAYYRPRVRTKVSK